MSLQGDGQSLEGGQSTEPLPRHPGFQLDTSQLGLVVNARAGENLTQCHLQSPSTRDFDVGPLQPVHGLDLRAGPAQRIPAHAPQDGAALLGRDVTRVLLHPRLVSHPLSPAHLVQDLAGEFDTTEAVVADKQSVQVGVGASEIGRNHCHADADGIRGLDFLIITLRRAGQQSLSVQIVHHDDVVVLAAQFRLVGSNDARTAQVLLFARLVHVLFEGLPKLFIVHTQIPGCLAHR